MTLNRRYRHFRRYRRIVEVLLRHGFGYFIESMDLEHLVPFGAGCFRDPREVRSRGARVRAAMEELGPTFIKFGQLLMPGPTSFPPTLSVN